MQYVTAEEGSAIKPPRRQSLPSRQEAQPDSSSEEEAEEEATNGKAEGEGEESSSEEEGEGQEEDVIALPSEKPSRSVLINRRLLEGMNKPNRTTQGDKPARHMGLDTGLPTPSYITYDSLGGRVMRATVGGGKEHPKTTLKDAMLGSGPSEAVQKKLAVQRVGIARQHLSRVCPCQCLDSVCCGCVCSVGCV